MSDRAAARRAAARVKIRADLAEHEKVGKRLLDKRDRKICESVDAGDSATVIAREIGIERKSVYTIRNEGRDRKGPITKRA